MDYGDNCTFPSPSHLCFSSFGNLSALYLSRVDVTDQVLADILCNCPLPEELSVEFSRVKYLELRLRLEEQDEHSILFLAAMIEACP
ncbi:hypothetical protein RHGRI_019340 [Rhododendron griersonianum]|uniref:Uncharacterized protein n=1 Tax=Rhododendron griersonianum TaxID=479676 RepID=A0AAV6JGX8_9ERIC|nr:hypothetical protein RHGRI_019340 [Rhododendron griersonianum]